MRIKLIAATIATVAALSITACSSNDAGTSTASNQAGSSMAGAPSMMKQPQGGAMRSGAFEGLNGKHVAGTVTVTGSMLEFANFTSDEGPDLHVYLTKGKTEADVSAGKQISPISFNQASQSFSLEGAMANDYTTVVIHCDKAKAIFGAASLM